MISKNVLNSFVAVFGCKVGVYYGFKCEISYQSWCCEKNKCGSSVLNALKVLKSKKRCVKIDHLYPWISEEVVQKCIIYRV